MKKILVVCPTYWDSFYLKKIHRIHECIFIGVDTDVKNFDALEFIEDTKRKYIGDSDIIGVIATHDYPGSVVASILAQELALPGCLPNILISIQHKYYARQMQQTICPDVIPRFCYVSPQNPKQISIAYPFFIKPVKAMFSFLATQISSEQELQQFIQTNKNELQRFIAPFNQLLQKYTSLSLDGNSFIAEQIITGMQVTVEGYVYKEEVVIIGIADSIMYPNTNSFARFEYPSKLPLQIQQKMIEISHQFILQSGYNNNMFNIEFFYDEQKNTIFIIEVNTRMSSIFADLIEKVDGTNSYAIQLDIAIGKKPLFVPRKGNFAVAAVFVLRVFEDKVVQRVPSVEEINDLQVTFPDMILKVDFAQGERLSSKIQSHGSYKYATVHLAGTSWEQLYRRFDMLEKRLQDYIVC